MEAKEDIQDSKDCKEGGQSARKEDIQDSNECMCTVLHCVPFASRYKTAKTSKASRASKGVQARQARACKQADQEQEEQTKRRKSKGREGRASKGVQAGVQTKRCNEATQASNTRRKYK